MVDWDLAGRTARRLISPGPETTREEAAAVVRELHEAAATAVAHVEELTGLRPAPGGPVPEVAVVDRPGWVDANTSGMAALLDPLVDALAEKQDARPGPLATAIGSRATGVQAGGLLAFLSSRVLGQYEVFGTGGRLLLVAPNIVAAERKLGVDPSDFRLWVCLHEVTHQLQFTAVPVAARPPRGRDRRVRRGHRPLPGRAARAAAGRAARPRRRRPRRRRATSRGAAWR